MPAANDTPVLVTGAAGFIGFHLARRLLAEGRPVLGVDDLDPYYDTRLKEARLAVLRAEGGPLFAFEPLDLADRDRTRVLFARHRPRLVLHMAAQAGVRYSIEAPEAYASSNIVGFLDVLEGCRHAAVGHLVYASSSSVYGADATPPYGIAERADRPVSLYAASKRSNELMAHAYAHLYRLPATGLRFFTVYGPWGRPDMAYYRFARAIAEGRPIELYNHGAMARDFTYVDDAVEAVMRLAALMPAGDGAPHRLYNIGSARPEPLLRLVELLEGLFGRRAERILLPMQPGDVTETSADIAELVRDTGYAPATPLEDGLARFVAWFRAYHAVP